MDIEDFLDEWYSASPYINVHTSGSTGKPKELSVEKVRMMASAKMTCAFWDCNATTRHFFVCPSTILQVR